MKITAIKGDITSLTTSAIVNAANEKLAGGGGVDGRIHQKAGPELLKACLKLGGCRPGEVKVTAAFNLSAQYIFHTVGPIWRGGSQNEAKILTNCYDNCLKKALTLKIKQIAFPAISCGVYGYPLQPAATIAVESCFNFQLQNLAAPEIIFCCFEEEIFAIYQKLLAEKSSDTP